MGEIINLFNAVHLSPIHLHQRVADAIQQIIAENQLQPGTRLPPERDLATKLGVNRSTVREAMRLLQQRGLVSMRVGSGTFFTGMRQDVLSDSLVRYFVFGDTSAEEFLVLREALEPRAASLAAKHATAEDTARLEALTSALEAAFTAADRTAYAERDAEFHIALAHASHNRLLIAIIAGLQSVMHLFMEAANDAPLREDGAYSHRRVVDAITRNDEQGAQAAMELHLSITRLSRESDAPTGAGPADQS